MFLKPDNIRNEFGLLIKEKIIPYDTKWPKTVYARNKYKLYEFGSPYKADRKLSGGSGKVEFITIHNTNRILVSSGTTMAEQYMRATWPNANMYDSRVHYYIDEIDCWQQLREDEVGWHAGDGNGPGNESSLAIEIIMGDEKTPENLTAENRGALLAAILLNRHNLNMDRLVTHNKWDSNKYCPLYILPHWDQFKNKVMDHLDNIKRYTNEIQRMEDNPAIGDLVSIDSSAKYYSGESIPLWVLNQNWYVYDITNGERVVINENESGTNRICSPIHKKYLKVVRRTPTQNS